MFWKAEQKSMGSCGNAALPVLPPGERHEAHMKMTRQEFLKALVAASAMPWVRAARAEQGSPIVVGATVPMTGPLSLTGK
ncbi:hypothetical protein XI07_05025 [Bradyrhizobium sp. CCBAU 11445]|nr:hypothetical protein [Bradyrhizobium sp. CCBAU 11445]